MTPETFEQISTLAELLEWRATYQGDKPAFAFLTPSLNVVATDTSQLLRTQWPALYCTLVRTVRRSFSHILPDWIS